MKKFRVYSFLTLATLLIILTFSFCNKKKNLAGDEFVGEWTNNGSTSLSVSEKKQGSYSRSSGGSWETATGSVKVSGSELKVGVKKFSLTAYPTEKIQGTAKNTYIVLDGDTLYKKPFTKPLVDYCKDGIRNNNEDGIDCGGICEDCQTCIDGKKNQNETGVDCGGVCEPCITNACNTDLGFIEGTYFTTGKQAIGAIGDANSDSAVDVLLSRLGSDYLIEFDKATFFTMPINTSRFVTIGDSYDKYGNPDRFCTVRVNLSGQLYFVEEGQKIYFTRIDQDHYSIKFCLLKLQYSTIIHYVSANANFKLVYE